MVYILIANHQGSATAMIDIIEQDIEVCLPSTRVNMVFMQPYVHFERPYNEPYKWQTARRGEQLRAIQRTLAIARDTGTMGHAHFTIFPEYAVPGLDGIRVIDEAIQSQDWPCGTIIIGGVDGLAHEDYNALCEMNATMFAPCNAPENVSPTEWVNCVLTWTKDGQGNVIKWVQPKLQPCELERKTPCQSMFHGGSIYLFSAQFDNDIPCRFFSVVCFDWIAAFNGIATQHLILSELDNRWKPGDPRALHWVFVIQQNLDPNDADFLRRTEDFLLDHQLYPRVNRRSACVVMANNALQDGPCPRGAGGFTSFVFEPDSPFVWDECRPTVSTGYTRHRKNGGFARCRDLTFREMGPCVQCAAVAVVPWVGTRTRDRCSAVEGGPVYSLHTPCSDPRFPERPVPPSVKWVNDEIDTIPSLANGDMRDRPLQAQVEQSHTEVAGQLRTIEEHRLTHRVRQATWLDSKTLEEIRKSTFENVDCWGVNEHEGLQHTIYVLSILALCYHLHVKESAFHGTLETPDGPMHIVAIRGPTHEDCRKHFDRTVVPAGPDPFLLVTRDQSNLPPIEDEMKKIYEPAGGTRLRHEAYCALIDKCRRATSEQQLRIALSEVFKPHDRKFI